VIESQLAPASNIKKSSKLAKAVFLIVFLDCDAPDLFSTIKNKGVHKIALLHGIVLPFKFLTPYYYANILFPGKQNAEMKS
jgi:hypothetical protein